MQSALPPGDYRLGVTLRGDTLKPARFGYRLTVPGPDASEDDLMHPPFVADD
jgi:hypothetical protein